MEVCVPSTSFRESRHRRLKVLAERCLSSEPGAGELKKPLNFQAIAWERLWRELLMTSQCCGAASLTSAASPAAARAVQEYRQPSIRASHPQVGKLLPEDTALCPGHKYLIALSARAETPTRARYSEHFFPVRTN